MTDDLQTHRADIAFLKALAEEGRSSLLLSGSPLVAAGLVFGAASIVHWLFASGWIVASPWAWAIIWLTATVIYLIVLLIILRSIRYARAPTGADRAVGAAWQGVGWTIFTLWTAVAIVCWRMHSAIPTLLLPSNVLALYGLAWTVAAAMTRKRWIALTAAASYVASLVLALFSNTPEVLLVFAAALVLLVATPGVALMRQARKTA